MKYFFSFAIFLFLGALILGFWAVGSPTEERLRRLDDRRINELSSIQYSIAEYFRVKQTVPDRLEELNDDITGYRIPVDPKNGNIYEYEKKGDNVFVLCAHFERESKSASPSLVPPVYYEKSPIVGSMVWDHGVGRVCFERTIDKDFYKPNP